MIVLARYSKDDDSARMLMEKFKADGCCPFGNERLHLGFLTRAEENDGMILFMVDITNPDAEKYYMEIKEGVRARPSELSSLIFP